jgi:hypothetical protein
VINWRTKTEDRDGWRKLLEHAKAHKDCSANNKVNNDNNNNNSIKLFINVPRQQPQGQLQTQHSVNKVITI